MARVDFTFYDKDVEKMLRDIVAEKMGVSPDVMNVTTFELGYQVGYELDTTPAEKKSLLTEQEYGWIEGFQLPSIVGTKKVRTEHGDVTTAYWDGTRWCNSVKDNTPFWGLGVGSITAWKEVE
tara:strand:+ start:93 stop:461 length:369 start_codon:yes stop_codon:yes gene_type:complete